MHEGNDAPRLRVALTQCTVTTDMAANLATVTELVERAATDRPDLIVLPENCLLIGSNDEMRAEALAIESPQIAALREAARRARVAVMLGGFKRRDPAGGVHNTALAIAPDGTLAGGYDKIHLFDAIVNGQSFEASRVEIGGTAPTILAVNGVKVAMTICYDVRFPELYRNLALAGTEVFLVPSAFTHVTGQAHWEVLLRARAIENAAFVVASATVGRTGAFHSWGHALAVDPWGTILADLGDAPVGWRTIEIDLARAREIRRTLPVLRNVRTEFSRGAPVMHQLDRVLEAGAANRAI